LGSLFQLFQVFQGSRIFGSAGGIKERKMVTQLLFRRLPEQSAEKRDAYVRSRTDRDGNKTYFS
jgi:hypothetical protein